MNDFPLLKFIGDASLNILWQSGNSTLMGIPEAIRNTISETYVKSRNSNEALYYLQVKTFLETINLDQNKVDQFIQKNPDHQRLGLEMFKILENTVLEKQSMMLAKVFRKYILTEITKEQFDKFSYIIMRLNNHLIKKIENIYQLYNSRKNDPNQSKYPEYSINIQNPNMELLSFDFLEPNEEPFWGGEQNEIYKKSKFMVTEDFLYFYNEIFQD